ncbi:MAG: YkgJ family cysteine cluster protein [Pseudomonadota bacterium]
MEILSQVTALFADIDIRVAHFQLKSGLRCSKGCSTCCPTGDVQTTILEMLPAAHEILFRGEASSWLERIAAQNPPGLCVFYQTHPASEAPGNCEFYTWRPAVCRLFGYAAVRNSRDKLALAICKHLKHADPDSVAAAISLENEAPSFALYGTRISGLNPVLGTKLMPINTALRHAVERLGLRMQMAYGEKLGASTAA